MQLQPPFDTDAEILTQVLMFASQALLLTEPSLPHEGFYLFKIFKTFGLGHIFENLSTPFLKAISS